MTLAIMIGSHLQSQFRRFGIAVTLSAVVIAAPLATAESARADTTVAEEVVARVEGRPILLSEIRARAKPFVKRAGGGPAAIMTETRKLYADLLERRIEEEVIAAVAVALAVTVTDTEIEKGMLQFAAQNSVDRDGLLAAALANGMTERDYRRELGREILRGKVFMVLGARDETVGSYPKEEGSLRAWYTQVERGPLEREKARLCIERLVRW